jgi:hypothetical protein
MNASSKIMLVCGFCISFGIYVSGIQQANWNIIDVGQQRSYFAQARMVSNAGLYNAMLKMAAPTWFDNNKINGVYTSPKIPVGSDTVWYTIDKNGLSSCQASVTITAQFNNVLARQKVIITKSPAPTDLSYLNQNRTDGNGPYCTWKVKQAYWYPYQLTASQSSPNSL